MPRNRTNAARVVTSASASALSLLLRERERTCNRPSLCFVLSERGVTSHRHSKSVCQRLPFVSLFYEAINNLSITVRNARTRGVAESMTSHLSKGERPRWALPSDALLNASLRVVTTSIGYPLSIHHNLYVHTHVRGAKPLLANSCRDKHSSEPSCLLSSFGWWSR